MEYRATSQLIGWNGEPVFPHTVAPVADWPQDYIDHLIAEGLLVGYPETPEEAEPSSPVPTDVSVLEVGGLSMRPPQQGGAA